MSACRNEYALHVAHTGLQADIMDNHRRLSVSPAQPFNNLILP